MEEDKKEGFKENEDEKRRFKSGNEMERELRGNRFEQRVTDRNVFSPINKRLKTKVIDPDSTERITSDREKFENERIEAPEETAKNRLKKLDNKYEYGRAVKAPRGYKTK